MTQRLNQAAERRTLFISKSNIDDPFVLWLAPKLEAAGYSVFADILCLGVGNRWRIRLTETLRNEAAKMLLCCSDETLARNGVHEEIGIAEDLSKELEDPDFIIPLRMRQFKKVFGIGEIQHLDFERGWATGLAGLLKRLEELAVPKPDISTISPMWQDYQRSQSVELVTEPEPLTSNWVRIAHMPDQVNLVRAKGVVDLDRLTNTLMEAGLSAVPFNGGHITFASPIDFEMRAEDFGGFETLASIGTGELIDGDWDEIQLIGQDARNILMNLMRQAWEHHCSAFGLTMHQFSKGVGALVNDKQVGIGKRISWGRQGNQRSSMLRNAAKKKVWEYGVSAQPSLFPFPHYRLKARVLFSELDGKDKGAVIEEAKAQHRFRRSVCSVWRNRAWHGRLMAFLEVLAAESPYIALGVGEGLHVLVDGMPVQGTSPVVKDRLSMELRHSTRAPHYGS